MYCPLDILDGWLDGSALYHIASSTYSSVIDGCLHMVWVMVVRCDQPETHNATGDWYCTPLHYPLYNHNDVSAVADPRSTRQELLTYCLCPPVAPPLRTR
jgi:hypothetical protein